MEDEPVEGESAPQAPDREIKNIDWVSCRDFTVEVGRRQIAEYINTWEVGPGWMFSLEHTGSSREEFHVLHRYRSRWSIPRPRAPIPRGTTSVYFFIRVSAVKPDSLPVEVRFVVESARLEHTPGRSRFREKWLLDVVESKALLQRDVDF